MDANECNTMIAAARGASGLSSKEALARMEAAAQIFSAETRRKFGQRGEW